MRFVYGGLSALMMVCAIIFFFICIFAYKVFLTELVVSLSTFVILGIITLVLAATVCLTYVFYEYYTESLVQ